MKTNGTAGHLSALLTIIIWGIVTWNFAVKALGAVKTSVYIYMVPVITVVTSVIILHEKISAWSAAGTVLTLAGLFLSGSKRFMRKEAKQNGSASILVSSNFPFPFCGDRRKSESIHPVNRPIGDFSPRSAA